MKVLLFFTLLYKKRTETKVTLENTGGTWIIVDSDTVLRHHFTLGSQVHPTTSTQKY